MSDIDAWVKRQLASPGILAIEEKYCPPALLATSPRHNPLLASDEPDELAPLDPDLPDLGDPRANELLPDEPSQGGQS